MNQYIESLKDLEGVRCILLLNGSMIVARRAPASIDEPMLARIVGALRQALDSLAEKSQEWERVIALFADGKMYLKNLGGKNVLAVIGDSQLNAAFTNVAVNIAADKIRLGLSASKPSVAISDPSSAEAVFLKQCTLALAQHTGPVAKVLVKQAIGKIAPDGNIVAAHFPRLVALLEDEIDAPTGRVDFRRAMATYVIY